MKLWKKPELKKLHLSQTKEDESDKNIALGANLFPNLNFYYTHGVLPSDISTPTSYIKSDEELSWSYENYTDVISLS